MSQRFYPYTPGPGRPLLCEDAHCADLAVWWDALYDAIWCDFHATAEVVAPVRVQCEVCSLMYPPSLVKNGVCADCRSMMPLMWVDELEVMR